MTSSRIPLSDFGEGIGLDRGHHLFTLAKIFRAQQDYGQRNLASDRITLRMILEFFAHIPGRSVDVLVYDLPTHRTDNHIVLHALTPLRIRDLLGSQHIHQFVAIAAERPLDDFPNTVLNNPLLHGHLRILRRLENQFAVNHLVTSLGVLRLIHSVATHLLVNFTSKYRLRADLSGDAIDFDCGNSRSREQKQKNKGEKAKRQLFHVTTNELSHSYSFTFLFSVHYFQSIAAMPAPTIGASSTCGVMT